MPRSRTDHWLAPLLPSRVLGVDALQRARCLAIGALLTAIAGLSLIPQIVARDMPVHMWVVVALTLTGSAITLLLVRSGRTGAAGHAFPGFAIGIGAFLLFAEGTASGRTSVLIVGVIMAGLLIRPSLALLYTAAAAGVIAAVYLLESSGWIAPAPAPAADAWVSSIRMVLMSGLLVTLLASVLRRTIDLLQVREAELSHNLAELERARATEDAARERLRQAEKLETLGRLAGGVAHDFNNLLTIIVGNSELALAGNRDPELLRQVASAAQRGAELTRQLLALGRQRPLPPRTIDAGKAIRELRPLLARLLGEAIRIETALAGVGATLHGDPGRFDQILVNLAVNAQQAMPDGGTLRFEIAAADAPGRFRLTVRDSGAGVPEHLRDRIFDPFFSTRPAGTGLGLATVREAVTEFGGSIAVRGEPGRGTAFVMEFECARPGAGPPEATSSPAVALTNRTVILVDDDPAVRRSVRVALEQFGCDVLVAADSAGAAEAARQSGRPVELCLTDVVLSQESGPEVAAAVRAVHPDCRVLYMSGYTAGELERRGIDRDRGFLAKPFTPEQLGLAVREMLGSPTATTR